MQIIDKLRLIFTYQFGNSFQLYPNLVITQKIIVKVMCKNCSMEIQRNMCLTYIRHMIFYKQYLKSILIDFLSKATSQFLMQLKSQSHQFTTFIWINQTHNPQILNYSEQTYFLSSKKRHQIELCNSLILEK